MLLPSGNHDLTITNDPFNCGWYNIEKFGHIHCTNGNEPNLKANFLLYYDHISHEYIVQQGTQDDKEFYRAANNLTLRRLFQRIFGEPGYTLHHQLESVYMSMADGSPLPEELDDILAIPMCDYHSYHPGASISFVITLEAPPPAPASASATTEDDLPIEDADLVALLALPPPPLSPQYLLQSDDVDPIELPAHLLID